MDPPILSPVNLPQQNFHILGKLFSHNEYFYEIYYSLCWGTWTGGKIWGGGSFFVALIEMNRSYNNYRNFDLIHWIFVTLLLLRSPNPITQQYIYIWRANRLVLYMWARQFFTLYKLHSAFFILKIFNSLWMVSAMIRKWVYGS